VEEKEEKEGKVKEKVKVFPFMTPNKVLKISPPPLLLLSSTSPPFVSRSLCLSIEKEGHFSHDTRNVIEQLKVLTGSLRQRLPPLTPHPKESLPF